MSKPFTVSIDTAEGVTVQASSDLTALLQVCPTGAGWDRATGTQSTRDKAGELSTYFANRDGRTATVLWHTIEGFRKEDAAKQGSHIYPNGKCSLSVEDVPNGEDALWTIGGYECESWVDFGKVIAEVLDDAGITDRTHRAFIRHEAQQSWRWNRFNEGLSSVDPTTRDKTFWVDPSTVTTN